MIQGLSGMTAAVTAPTLARIVMDCERRLQVSGVSAVEQSLEAERFDQALPLAFERRDDQLWIDPGKVLVRGDTFTVLVSYSGQPLVVDDFTGFHFKRTADGQPWICPSVQTVGAHTWWPCKASFFHPEDKNRRLFQNLTVPRGLTAAGIGRLLGVEEHAELTTWRWRHDYPLPTYAVSMAIAPYVELQESVDLPGLEEPLAVHYWVLPQDVEKARLQFAEVPELLRFFSELFGPYPFPRSKFALAQAPVWGMEHCTLIAYGNSFPAYLQQEGLPDPFEETNRLYDYILVHEAAHEWWGNTITAESWGDFWLHEGFATYAEALWVEKKLGQEAYLEFLEGKRRVPTTATVFRPLHGDAGQAYNGPHTNAIYDKGAQVLHMLRYVIGDAAFFAALKDFATDPRYRYGTASSLDFQRICEKHHGAELNSFFQPWLYGTGWPHYVVRAPVLEGARVQLEIECRGRSLFEYVMPVEVELHCEDGRVVRQRPLVRSGLNKLTVEAPAPVREVRYPGFRWILCRVSQVP